MTELERRIAEVEAQLEGIARQSPVIRRLRTIPGVGLLTATAMVACLGDLRRFPSARHFASSLGLTPLHPEAGDTSSVRTGATRRKKGEDLSRPAQAPDLL